MIPARSRICLEADAGGDPRVQGVADDDAEHDGQGQRALMPLCCNHCERQEDRHAGQGGAEQQAGDEFLDLGQGSGTGLDGRVCILRSSGEVTGR